MIALLLLFTVLGLGAWATVKVVKAAARGVDRTVSQARRAVEDTTLKAKSFGQVGVAGALAQLRLDLRTSMRATQQALQEGARADASLQESLALFERLSVHGRELDEELKRLETEPDKARLSALLPELRERTGRITEAANSLRWAARDRANQFAKDEMSLLTAEIEVESGALRDWSRPSMDDLLSDLSDFSNRASQAQAQAPGPQTQAPAGPQTQAPAGAQSQAAQPSAAGTESAGAPTAPQDPRRALNPAPRPTPYPWEKSSAPASRPRPETTT
ncbi:hypothetical protein DEJ50_22635 [Streptomyces venezuelae]|uniref:Secreted protein n=2 Tax=Streptomyces venezuelae TaxID=54571 RepID=A0A5P2DHX0_STRVZ|nr:hypothetical protein DEJ50_22635 [Streptomyces venezuelae]